MVIQWVFLSVHIKKGIKLSSRSLKLLLLTLGSRTDTSAILRVISLILSSNPKLLLVISLLHFQMKFSIFSLTRCEYRHLPPLNQKFFTKSFPKSLPKSQTQVLNQVLYQIQTQVLNNFLTKILHQVLAQFLTHVSNKY